MDRISSGCFGTLMHERIWDLCKLATLVNLERAVKLEDAILGILLQDTWMEWARID
jgi:hypothetical protein